MTAFNYARMTAVSDRLIERFGSAGSIRRRTTTGPAYDPTQGDPVDHACRFVVSDYSAMEVDGTRVLATDKKVILSKGALTIEPSLNDVVVETGGTVYKIVSIKPLEPGSAVVLWELQVRR